PGVCAGAAAWAWTGPGARRQRRQAARASTAASRAPRDGLRMGIIDLLVLLLYRDALGRRAPQRKQKKGFRRLRRPPRARQPACAAWPEHLRGGRMLLLRWHLALPARDDDGGQAVADDVHRRPGHVHELVDAQDGQDRP